MSYTRRHDRFTAKVTIDFLIEVSAPDDDEAAERLGDILSVLIDRQPDGALYRSYAPRHIAGRPTVRATGGDCTAPKLRTVEIDQAERASA